MAHSMEILIPCISLWAQYSVEEQGRDIRDSFFNNYWEVHINEPSMLNLIQMYGVK